MIQMKQKHYKKSYICLYKKNDDFLNVIYFFFIIIFLIYKLKKMTFIEENKKYINELIHRFNSFLKQFEIGQDELDIMKIFEIVSELIKIIRDSKNIYTKLNKIEDNKKITIIIKICIEIINHELIEKNFNEKQYSQVKKFINNEKYISIILKIINWIAIDILQKIDANKDNVITRKEFVEYGKKMLWKYLLWKFLWILFSFLVY